MNKNDLLLIRPFKAKEDTNFIYVHWLRGLRKDNDLFHLIDREIYFDTYRKVVESLLRRSLIQMAVLKDSPDVILGFSVYEKTRLHWVYVKEDWRRLGIAKDLLKQLSFPCEYSHITNLALQILKEKKVMKHFTFNPFF